MPLTPFFWYVKVRVTNVTDWRLASVAVSAKIICTQLNTMSSRQKGVLLELKPVYSPGQRRNNYANIIMSHSAQRTGSPDSVVTLEIFCRTSRGVRFTQLGGGLFLV